MTIVKNKRSRNVATIAKRLPREENKGIQLLLIQTVDPLGKQGDIVYVKPGYANNYLIPQGLATAATDHHKRMIEKHKAKLFEIHRQRLTGFQTLAEEIRRKSISIEANANEEGHLYGSVGPDDIAKALRLDNIALTADQVRLTGPLKELGLYTVRIYLGHDIESELKVWVVPVVGEKDK
ncbi:MAG: 50S ribosomal protein L9 [Planctomycetaceae bacterium]|jgi:large subunit ribosomal protein L9|nr:50S ribosomal protein L9 [Planctomycetaceae bacterium]